MPERVSINLGDEQGSRTGKRRVDIGKKFRHIIMLVLVLYALSWLQTTVMVDKVMTTFLK